MKRVLKVSGLFLALAVASVWAMPEKPVTLGKADSGKTITVPLNQIIFVNLAGNITTGYSWELKGIKGESVKSTGDIEYKADAHPPGMTGSGGMFVAHFKAAKGGQSTLTL